MVKDFCVRVGNLCITKSQFCLFSSHLHMPPIIFGSLAYEDFKTNIKFERLFGKNLKDFTSYI